MGEGWRVEGESEKVTVPDMLFFTAGYGRNR
jgi:hypothetical protein